MDSEERNGLENFVTVRISSISCKTNGLESYFNQLESVKGKEVTVSQILPVWEKIGGYYKVPNTNLYLRLVDNKCIENVGTIDVYLFQDSNDTKKLVERVGEIIYEGKECKKEKKGFFRRIFGKK